MGMEIYQRLIRFIGKSPINPFLFYSGKTACALLTGWFLIHGYNSQVELLSIGIFGFGVIILLISWMQLGSSTRIGLPDETTELKTDGLYQISRNPLYIGLYLISVACVVHLMSWWALMMGIYCIAVHHRIILAEESFLLERFDDDYRHYSQSVRRYL